VPRASPPATSPSPATPPSATVRWEYRNDGPGETQEQWTELNVIEDGTLGLSRTGDLIFKPPTETDAGTHKALRAVLTGGTFEIPPRIVSIRTNTVRARQVETVVNEDLGLGLGTADQLVRLKKYPLLINTQIDDGPFQVGEVLDWEALVGRLRDADVLYGSPLRETIHYLLDKLNDIAGATIDLSELDPTDRLMTQQYELAAAFDTLLNDSDLYNRSKFSSVNTPQEFKESGRCQNKSTIRQFNRLLLQLVFPDLFVSDRFELQVGLPAERTEDEVRSWHSWSRVDDFLKSGPDDYHYVLDEETGTVLFGNGLNGKVPQTSEFIRARFYRYSQSEQGNIKAGHQWVLDLLPPNTTISKQINPTAAVGGRRKETIDETKIRTREVFRKERAVLTGSDFEALALNTPGLRVARAKVIPNFNPKFPCLQLPGEVTLIVEPQPPPRAAFPDATPVGPSDGFLRTIQNLIENRRIVTTNIHVIGPTYVEVNVSGRVFLKKRASESDVSQSLNRALSQFLDPVFGGPDGKGWPFGRSIFPSEISQQLVKVDGVDYVTKIAVNGLEPGKALAMPYNGLPTTGKHSIVTVTFEARGSDANSAQQDNGCV